MHRSKLHKAQSALYDRNTRYEFAQAVELLKSMPHVKFDETVDLALKLGIDPRKSDQNVRGAVALPYGTGKTVRVCVVADGAQAEDAKAAGAGYRRL